MIVKVLGTGCSKCQSMEKEVINALAELNVAADVQKITKMDEIMQYAVMITPALIVNEKVKVSGRVPKRDELKKFIQEEI